MTKTGMYCLRIREQRAPHCWLCGQNADGGPTTQSGKPANAARFGFEAAKVAGQKWADWLVANGHAAAAKRVEVCPATGGAATGWRPTVVESPAPAADAAVDAVACDHCDNGAAICGACNGTGSAGGPESRFACFACGGSGTKQCQACGGAGELPGESINAGWLFDEPAEFDVVGGL